MQDLVHITKESGHVRQSPRREVADEVIEVLTPLLEQALDTGDCMAVGGSGWFFTAKDRGGEGVDFELWYSDGDGPAHILMQVERGDPPRCEVSTAGMIQDGMFSINALAEAGDLERCLAWAWLERD